MSEVAEFAVKKLKQYAEENNVLPRSTTDLSPLEQWLLLQLFNTNSVWKRAVQQVNRWRFFNKGVKRLEFVEKEESVERDHYLNGLGYIKIKGEWFREMN